MTIGLKNELRDADIKMFGKNGLRSNLKRGHIYQYGPIWQSTILKKWTFPIKNLSKLGSLAGGTEICHTNFTSTSLGIILNKP